MDHQRKSKPIPADAGMKHGEEVNGQGDTHKLIVVPSNSDIELYANPATRTTSTTDILIDAAAASSAKIYNTGCKFKSIVASSQSGSTTWLKAFWKHFKQVLKISLLGTFSLAVLIALIWAFEVRFGCRGLTIGKSTVEYTTWLGVLEKYHVVPEMESSQPFPGVACLTEKEFDYIQTNMDKIAGGFRSFYEELIRLWEKPWKKSSPPVDLRCMTNKTHHTMIVKTVN